MQVSLWRKNDERRCEKEENVDKRDEKVRRRARDEKRARKTENGAMKKKWTIKPIG